MKKADVPTWNYSVEVSAVESPRENMNLSFIQPSISFLTIDVLSDYHVVGNRPTPTFAEAR